MVVVLTHYLGQHLPEPVNIRLSLPASLSYLISIIIRILRRFSTTQANTLHFGLPTMCLMNRSRLLLVPSKVWLFQVFLAEARAILRSGINIILLVRQFPRALPVFRLPLIFAFNSSQILRENPLSGKK